MPTEHIYSRLLRDILPLYAEASSPPSYSCDPVHGEERIEHTPSVRGSHPTGTFVKKHGSVTVVLHDQEDGATTPTFGRRSKINGVLLLDKNEETSRVTVQMTGQLDYLNSAGGSTSIQTLRQKVTVWSAHPNGDHQGDTCPSSLTFSFSLPATYQDGDNHVSLPPSFIFTQLPVVMVTSVYALTIHVSYIRQNLSFISKAKCLRVPLRYHPRARPNRPIIRIPLFCGLKSAPEEWIQSIIDMKIKPNTMVLPIYINILIPSVQIFAISDVIPFHIQLNGSLSSLQRVFPSSPATPLTVTLLRRVTTIVRGSCANQHTIIGDGKLWPVPPTTSQLASPPSEDEVLDWEGEIQCNSNVSVGSFAASGVTVKDFLHVVVHPPASSPFLPTHGSIPVRFVTDPWIDSPDYYL